jgi:hypothetical protein
MKTIYITLFFLILLAACTSAPQSNEKTTPVSKPSFTDLLSQYKELNIDTFAVYSNANEYDNDSYPFKGKPIDSSFFYLFPQEIQNLLFSDSELFACYKIKIDNQLYGLITRTPSEYVASSVKLLIVDINKKQFLNSYELSESWGDAGDAMEKDSWLYKNNSNNLEWFYHRMDCFEADTMGMQDCVDSMSIYTFIDGKSKIIPADSISLAALKEKLMKHK